MARTKEDTLRILRDGEMSVRGKFLWGSNFTFLVGLSNDQDQLLGVYKPTRGERPLWDFPTESLAGREVAAYLVSEALSWNLVPPTAFREEGPHGAGSVQLYIEHDPEYHYFNFETRDRDRLRPVAIFDLLINNADRKGSHVLIGPDKKIFLIDHGICFHAEHKLRTVIWDFAGEVIDSESCSSLQQLIQDLQPEGALHRQLSVYLTPREISALARRAQEIVASGHFPNPRPDFRPYPWPPV